MREVTQLKQRLRESPDMQRLRHRRRMLRVRLVGILSIFFVVLCYGLIFFSRYQKIQVSNISVTGNQITETSEVVAHVNKILEGNYAYVIPRRNFYLFPKSTIVSDLLNSFPRIRSVSITKTNLNSITVNINEVHAIALWCGLGTDTVDANVPCYFTDDAGKVVAPAPYYSGNVYRRFFGSTLLKEGGDFLGHNFISQEGFNNLLIFAERITSAGFSIRGIVIGSNNEDSFVVEIGQGKTAVFRFRAGDDYHILADNFTSAIGKAELSTQLKKDKTNLEYFDLRFTNKVYYKFSDSTTPTAPVAKPTTPPTVAPVDTVKTR